MALGLNRKGQNKNLFTKNGLPIGLERQRQTMPLGFFDSNSPPVAAVHYANRKVMEKNCTQRGLKNQKIDNIEFRKKKITKCKIDVKFKIIKKLERKELLSKN